jgi:hypothetical protein
MFFYFLPFVVGCALVFAAMAWRPRLAYEFPYFMGAVFIAFILPQLYGLYLNNWGGEFLEKTVLMSALCLGACWVGYQPRTLGFTHRILRQPLNSARFLHGGIALVAIGWFFNTLFSQLPEDDISGLLTGRGTIYLFFSALVYPGFAICFYAALKERKAVAWLAAVLAAIIPIETTIFYGRREPTVLFVVAIGLCFYFLRGKPAPRWVVVGSILAAMFAIPATGAYRGLSKESPWTALKQINFEEEFAEYFDDEKNSEMKNATIYISAISQSEDYEWGAGYWNRIVFRFVPAQLLGAEFKNSLMIGGAERNLAEYVEENVGFQPNVGTTFTGIGDSFGEFGYFGALVFAAIAYLFKNLWSAANSPDGTAAQILYIQVITSAMRALTHQTLDFLPGFLYSVVFLGLVVLYAKESVPLGSKWQWRSPSRDRLDHLPPARRP